MFEYSIIIPTHNRHKYLERSLKYFSVFKANIVCVDSSDEIYEGCIPGNTIYMHLPSLSFPEKALIALDKCKTKYVAFCADDDFLIESSLSDGLIKLSANNKLTAAVGRYLGFDEEFDDTFFKILNHSDWPITDIDNEANVANFFANYHQILWALYKVETIKLAYQIVLDAKFSNDNFIELVIGAVCSGSGGIVFLNSVWGVREISLNQHWGLRHMAIRDAVNSKGVKKDMLLFNKLLSEKLFLDAGNIAIKNYLESSPRDLNSIAIKKIKSVMPAMLKNVLLKKQRILYSKDQSLEAISLVLKS